MTASADLLEQSARRVLRAARRVIDPREKLLTRKPRDWMPLYELQEALDALQWHLEEREMAR